ncbi:DUF411 domain-containing protein [Pseudomonadota bacterium]
MKYSLLTVFTITTALFLGCTSETTATPTEVMVYKTSVCPCCEGWMAHMQKEGFSIKAENRDNDIDKIKAANGVTQKLASCHTAKVEGYVIEGHVPATDVKRLLKEKPSDVVGLTAPGMPLDSPGMQAEGLPPKGYNVIAIKKDGTTEVYTRY